VRIEIEHHLPFVLGPCQVPSLSKSSCHLILSFNIVLSRLRSHLNEVLFNDLIELDIY
jgi:hypothetical protein